MIKRGEKENFVVKEESCSKCLKASLGRAGFQRMELDRRFVRVQM